MINVKERPPETVTTMGVLAVETKGEMSIGSTDREILGRRRSSKADKP
jgi:hypothetical protein